jgi:hypothetical protein
MNLLRAVGRFLYDFLIGDDWRILAGVLASLLVGRLLLATSLPATIVALLTGALLVASFVLNLLVGARR